MSGEDCCDEFFESVVQAVGIKAFAAKLGLSARQVHRMIGGAQPNPLRRFCDILNACDAPQVEAILSCVCRQQGVYWVRSPETIEAAHLNAVKESAEAIVAITEGRSTSVAIREIREAISALVALEKILDGRDDRHDAGKAKMVTLRPKRKK